LKKQFQVEDTIQVSPETRIKNQITLSHGRIQNDVISLVAISCLWSRHVYFFAIFIDVRLTFILVQYGQAVGLSLPANHWGLGHKKIPLSERQRSFWKVGRKFA